MMETRLDIQANGMQFHGQQQPAMYAIPFAPNPMNMQYNMQGMNVQQFMDMIIQTARQEACKEAERIVECARRRTEDLTSKVAGWIENVKSIGAQNNYMQQQLAGVVHQLKVMSEEKNKTGKDINFSIDTCRKSIEMVKQNLGQVWLEFNDQCRKIHSIMERQDVSGKIISESTDKQDKKSTKEENGDRRQRRHTDTEPMNRADSGGTERKRRNTMTNPTAGQQQVSKLKLVDKVGNILDAPDEFAVAHAVDGTLHMGAGAAADISAHLLQEDEVKMNRRVSHRVGEVITMNSKKGKKVLCVVTKPHYKMNYNKHKNKAKFMYFMTQGLRGMKRECVKHDIKKLAIPAMGSGLDQIPWHLVQQRIANIFDSMDMIIEVYHMPKGNVRGPQGSDTAAGLEDNTGNTSAQNQNTTETPIPQNNTGTSSVNAADPAATPRNRTRTTSVNSADSAMSPRRGQVQNISKPAVPPKPVGHSRTADTQPKDNRQGEVPINITGQARVDSVEIIKNHNDSSNHISQISESDVLSFRQNQEGKAPKEAITEDDNADGNKQTADSATRRGRASLGTLATVASNCPYEGANQHDKMERKIKLKTLNTHITCKICRGYLVEATTVTECLHTFCKSCLVKHLEENNTCPSCQIVIHQSHPLQYISFDRTMQDIVFKLVPGLQDDEIRREREFYRARGLPCPRDVPLAGAEPEDDKSAVDQHAEADYHRQDEQVNLSLECVSSNLRGLNRRFLRCSAQATITHLKKFLAAKVLNAMDKYKDIDVLCNDELLGKDHTLKFVFVTRWRFKEPPMILQYRPRIDL